MLPSPYFAWLLRPLIDLGSFEIGPFYSEAVEFHWRAIQDPALAAFGLQRILPAGFRETLVHEARRPELALADPRALADERRSPRWAALCAYLDNWQELLPGRRSRLVRLLHAMCWYELVLELVPESAPDAEYATEDHVEFAYLRASARYMLDMPARIEDYVDASLAPFVDIAARAAPVAPQSAFNAAVKVFVHGAKSKASPEWLAERGAVMQRRIEDVQAALPPFTAGLLTSRYHRAMAYLPMAQGRHAAMSREMDEAERLARALEPGSAAEALLARENLHPVLESRAKESELKGEWDLALARAEEVVDLDPHDPKSWLELGALLLRWRPDEAASAYVSAARLGPPVSAIAHHMAGACLQRAGRDALAAYFLQSALQIDPLGISPRVAIQALPSTAGLEGLKDWSSRRMERRA